MDINDLIKSSIGKKATDFKEIFSSLMQSKILDKISAHKDTVGKAMFSKEK